MALKPRLDNLTLQGKHRMAAEFERLLHAAGIGGGDTAVTCGSRVKKILVVASCALITFLLVNLDSVLL